VQNLPSGLFANDSEIIQKIDSLPADELCGYSNFYPQDLRHYLSIQNKWLQDEIYYLGQKLNRQPLQKEIIEDLEKTNNAVRFRAFYCLKYSDKIKI